jgi:hypothetical protein
MSHSLSNVTASCGDVPSRSAVSGPVAGDGRVDEGLEAGEEEVPVEIVKRAQVEQAAPALDQAVTDRPGAWPRSRRW